MKGFAWNSIYATEDPYNYRRNDFMKGAIWRSLDYVDDPSIPFPFNRLSRWSNQYFNSVSAVKPFYNANYGNNPSLFKEITRSDDSNYHLRGHLFPKEGSESYQEYLTALEDGSLLPYSSARAASANKNFFTRTRLPASRNKKTVKRLNKLSKLTFDVKKGRMKITNSVFPFFGRRKSNSYVREKKNLAKSSHPSTKRLTSFGVGSTSLTRSRITPTSFKVSFFNF